MGNTLDAPTRLPDDAELVALAQLQQALLTSYDERSDRHLSLLRQIWSAFSFEEEFTIPHANWKSIGFQGSDPGSDVRGGGELSLRALSWFCTQRRETARGMKEKRKTRKLTPHPETGEPRSYPNYPWAAAGINITRMLGELFSLVDAAGRPAQFAEVGHSCWAVCRSEATFFALFAYVFERLDEMWDAENASYMDFPIIIKRVKAELVETLQKGPGYLSEIIFADSGIGDGLRARLPSTAEWGPTTTAAAAAAVSVTETESTTADLMTFSDDDDEDDDGGTDDLDWGYLDSLSKREEEEEEEEELYLGKLSRPITTVENPCMVPVQALAPPKRCARQASDGHVSYVRDPNEEDFWAAYGLSHPQADPPVISSEVIVL